MGKSGSVESSSINIHLPLSVSLPDLLQNLGFGQTLSRQIEVEKLGNVPRAQQRCLNACIESHLDGEKQREADETDVMVPTLPNPHLILRHAELAFRLMKGVLDPKSLALHPCVMFPGPTSC